jgi:chemotaxis protein methyltransferase CheR
VSIASAREDLERFRTAIIQRMGLQFDDARLGFLGEVLQRRLHRLGQSSANYLLGLESRSADDEFNVLARELTVGETYFFRNIEQFRALAEAVLPARMNARRGTSSLRLLSAGCASGEEPYSIAIVAKETIAEPNWDVDIMAVDLNTSSLEKAQRACYSAWVLRETPEETRKKWFRVDGRELLIDQSIRDAVQFREANLASDDPSLWRPAYYDVIFCRNVLMYFSPEQMRAVIKRIAYSLAPGGFLFLGHAETLRGVSDRFHLHHSHNTFYHSVKDESEVFEPPFAQITPKAISPHASPVAFDDAWYQTIAKASERVAALVPDMAGESTTLAQPPLAWNVAAAFDLIRQERFAEALNHVRSRPAAAGKDPDVLLLEATLLAHSGQLTAAEDACLRLLLADEFNAGAHYVLALCREHAGQIERAIEHDRVASYLDPEFAMPRLHSGLLSARAGDRARARRDLMHALELLKREDPSRLLLFGGGFNREALISLCRSALKDNGGET